MIEFRSTHNLPFEACPWPRCPEIQLFRIGTCNGQWTSSKDCYVIISVINEQPGNGHLEDVFEWFENSCKRDGKALVITDFFNKRFKKYCIKKRGFEVIPSTNDVIKEFSESRLSKK